ncbi:unnamed protein product, partial [Mesorhabditis spiculigera]
MMLLTASCLELQDLLEMLEMMDLKKFLGGNIEVDTWLPLFKYPSILGQFKLSYPCDLICDSFDAFGSMPCRWRNEWTICGSGDELDWVRACGNWGDEQAKDIFSTKIRPEGPFLLAGTQKKLPPDHSAMLVSDPIQCQQGDGKLTFNHWTSPRVKLRVCVRRPGSGKIYEWCSNDIWKGAPGPTTVIIPGSIMHNFEIVIEAYNFVLNNFGKQGGMAAVDTITYEANQIYNCDFVPHFEPPIPLEEETCKKLTCDFDATICVDFEDEFQDFKIGYSHVGTHHSGVRKPLRGDFAYARGPASSSLEFTDLNITRTAALEFCYYRSTFYPKLDVLLGLDEENDTTLFTSTNYTIHSWQCERVYIEPGEYLTLVFQVSEMRNSYSIVALDEINLIDPTTGLPCKVDERLKMPISLKAEDPEENEVMVVGRAFARRRVSSNQQNDRNAERHATQRRRQFSRQDAVAKAGKIVEEPAVEKANEQAKVHAGVRRSLDFPTAVIEAARRASVAPNRATTSKEPSSSASSPLPDDYDRKYHPNKRRVVDVSDVKTCALLMTKMKEESRIPGSPQYGYTFAIFDVSYFAFGS